MQEEQLYSGESIEPSVYSELPENDSFRLLRLKHGTGTGELQGQLSIYPLSEAPPYEALSYVWGDAATSGHINCAGKDLPITPNLTAAIYRLRLTSVDRCLWIDQLCINQDNLQERSKQVNMMRLIYKSAETVLVWLGPDHEQEAEHAKSLITAIILLVSIDVEEDIIEKMMHFPTDKALIEHGLPPRDHPQWDALVHLSRLSYFTRVWVIQEVSVASKVLMIWGETEFDMLDFRSAMSWASRNNCAFSTDVEPAKNSKPGLDAAPFMVINRLSGSLLELLARTEACQASDPRDKVYALLGLVDDHLGKDLPLPKADYTRPLARVYCDITRYIISLTQSLEVLCYNVSLISPEESFPSWMPRFDQGIIDPWRLYGEHDACGSTIATVRETDEEQLLLLEGIRIDEVQCAEIILEEDEPPDTMSEAWKMAMDRLSDTKSLKFLFKDFIFVMTGGTMIDDHSAPIPASDTLLLDFLDYQTSRILRALQTLSTKQPAKCLKSMLEMAEIATSLLPTVDGMLDINDKHFSSRQRIETENQLAQCHPDASSTMIEELASRLESLWVDNDWRRFSISFANAGEFRRFFITKKGSMGIGPQAMQSGDIICILFGGRTPFVLRPRPDSDHCVFIGECYIHGWMHGEAIEKWRQGMFQSEYFTLD
ncbi:hypothetical protein MMC17_006313 [Xylographa soralifera]|nr:hypothetical protein [Xylographa soralifera]